MATKAYKWRTEPTGVEGTSTRYVDSATGSDLYGDGTRVNPYQSLGKAYRATTTKPSKIVCRGRFSEMLADGNHACTIDGDYYGAATFDGADYYLIYGFRHNNMIIVNTGVGTYDLAVFGGSEALAGVGGASAVGHVGYAGAAYGVAGSPVLMDRVSLYMGIIGGTSACKYLGVSRAKHNGVYRISFAGYQSDVILAHSTVYGVAIADRCKSQSTSTNTIQSTIFSDFAMIANDNRVNYVGCLFAADSHWYYLSDANGNKGTIVEFTLTGTTSAERQQSLLTQLAAKYEELEVPTAQRLTPVFTDCLFSSQTAAQLFNGAANQDFTLKNGSDGIINEATYYGAFPPALNVPIMTDSTGVAGTWDERSASGCLAVADNAICIDETSVSMDGEILSKIVKIDPASMPLNGIFTAFASKFTDYYAYLNRRSVTGQIYAAGATLPVGRYIVKGAIVYGGTNIGNNAIVVVSQENTTFANDNYESALIAIEEPNVQDVVYCRCRATVYVKIKAAAGLQRGATYLNTGLESITYHGRTIAAGESFVALNSDETFTAVDADYEIGIMFDDTRVPSAEWIPAQMFGEYFVMKQSGAIKLDDDGVPVSSGNYLSFQTTANGGYSDQLRKTIINQAYVQFAIFVKKYDHIG